MYNEVRQCAEVHREVRKYIDGWVKPGMKLIDVCETHFFVEFPVHRGARP